MVIDELLLACSSSPAGGAGTPAASAAGAPNPRETTINATTDAAAVRQTALAFMAGILSSWLAGAGWDENSDRETADHICGPPSSMGPFPKALELPQRVPYCVARYVPYIS